MAAPTVGRPQRSDTEVPAKTPPPRGARDRHIVRTLLSPIGTISLGRRPRETKQSSKPRQLLAAMDASGVCHGARTLIRSGIGISVQLEIRDPSPERVYGFVEMLDLTLSARFSHSISVCKNIPFVLSKNSCAPSLMRKIEHIFNHETI